MAATIFESETCPIYRNDEISFDPDHAVWESYGPITKKKKVIWVMYGFMLPG